MTPGPGWGPPGTQTCETILERISAGQGSCWDVEGRWGCLVGIVRSPGRSGGGGEGSLSPALPAPGGSGLRARAVRMPGL